jgi:hypothetical protein
MTEINSENEYAVEVVGRGYVFISFPSLVVSDKAAYQTDVADVHHTAELVRKAYISMGCPEVAETVRVVSRTVTVTRGEWEPYCGE